MKNIHAGLAILMKYNPDDDISADYDMIYAGGISPEHMEPGDVSELEVLGWHWNTILISWYHGT